MAHQVLKKHLKLEEEGSLFEPSLKLKLLNQEEKRLLLQKYLIRLTRLNLYKKQLILLTRKKLKAFHI